MDIFVSWAGSGRKTSEGAAPLGPDLDFTHARGLALTPKGARDTAIGYPRNSPWSAASTTSRGSSGSPRISAARYLVVLFSSSTQCGASTQPTHEDVT